MFSPVHNHPCAFLPPCLCSRPSWSESVLSIPGSVCELLPVLQSPSAQILSQTSISPKLEILYSGPPKALGSSLITFKPKLKFCVYYFKLKFFPHVSAWRLNCTGNYYFLRFKRIRRTALSILKDNQSTTKWKKVIHTPKKPLTKWTLITTRQGLNHWSESCDTKWTAKQLQ